jgi:hypothetical protein
VNWNSTGTPTVAQCTAAIDGAVPYLPTPTINHAALARPVVVGPTTTGSLGAQRHELAFDLYQDRNCDLLEWFDELLGNACPMDDDVIWAYMIGAFVGGDAANIPSNTLISDTSVVTFAHEMGHCLDQRHVNTCGAAGGDDAAGWNNGLLADVPFNYLTNTVVQDAGHNAFELMSYCSPLWPSPRRWDQMWNFVGT